MVNKCLTRTDIHRMPEVIDFPAEETIILNTWRDEKTFEKCSQISKGKPKYTFYDGPPFATGLPHYGHILAGTIKDIVTRYAYQKGYHVDRRFGWDCHGLPVEFEIDKLLNIKGPEDVAKMGIAAYNGECRKIVLRYSNEWEEIVTRMGRWIDFKNDYKTLYPWYMETIWWVFKQLYDKGLIYQGVKVMPYSTTCTTALSNFESGQNYKEVVDPCVTVSLQAINHENTYFLIWTTTPWTLPSNFSCCVNPNMIYVKVKDHASNRLYILAECRLNYVYKNESEYEIIEKFRGEVLKGEHYKPVFPYFEEQGKKVGAFQVLVDDYVTEESGTGIVHNAPYFGEDDYRICLSAGLITKSSAIICPLDDSGRFTAEVTDFVGQYVKDADKNIIAMLRSNGALFSLGQVKHSYPFCWRSDTPLIYKAVPSWFVRVEHMSKSLLSASSQTYWVPDFVKEKRFGNWLRDARDWAISRNRYWGTPIPIWRSQDGEETVCIGSIKELEALTGKHITDLHREIVDAIEIPSAIPGRPPLKRINAVFDCWFESGSMPFAQQHFPFENSKDFLSNFPADFIAEGIDQTRGWFYTLLVISTALFNQAPFKNLIANGLVLASDGQKMSKRKKNYPDPMKIVHSYGADALRLYLINSPVVRAENLRFKEEGVRDIVKDVFLPWYNAFRFLLQNIERFEKENNKLYNYDQQRHWDNVHQSCILDVWILSFKESLIDFFSKEMKHYRLYTVVPKLTKFIEQLTNWYIRLNRRRIKGELGSLECIQSLDTLFDILFTMVKIMAPFTPFLSEYFYKRLILFQLESDSERKETVHLEMMPICNHKFIRSDIEQSVQLMQSVVELGRVMRDRRTLPVKYPVSELIVIHKDPKCLEAIKCLQDFIITELNVRKLTLSADKAKYGVSLRAEPDHKSLGQRLKGDFRSIMANIKSLNDEEIQKGLSNGYFEILNHRIETSEMRILYSISGDVGANFEAHSDQELLVLMDMTPNDELLEEGLAREVINRVQKLKKKAKLIPTDPVQIYYEFRTKNQTENDNIIKIINLYSIMISTAIKADLKPLDRKNVIANQLVLNETVDLKGIKLDISIYSATRATTTTTNLPTDIWLNILLSEDLMPRYGKSKKGSILLKNYKTKKFITLEELKEEVENLFGLFGLKYNFYIFDEMANDIYPLTVLVEKLNGKTLLIAPESLSNNSSNYVKKEYKNGPYCKFINVDGQTVFLENPLGVAV